MSKKTIIAAAAVVIAAAGAFVGHSYLTPKSEPEAVALPVVRTTQPTAGDIELFRSMTGTIEPADSVYVIPKAAGEITAVYVKTGDYVEEGQLLCEIDTKQVDAARLQLEAAEIALHDARTNLERMRVLYGSGDISAQAFEQVESGAKSAQIQYDSAKLAYDYQVEFSSITATIAGKIESSTMEVHDMASQSSPLCVISSQGAKNVNFAVTEAILDNVKEGDQIRIEKGGSEYTGIVTEVSTMVDAATGLFKVKASVTDGSALANGSSVKLYVTSDRAMGVMTVPVDAVYYDNGEPYVYTFDSGTVHRIDVETGISDSEKMEITSGLTAADYVITTWSPELYEGASAVLEPATEAAAE
ncbi:MAG: efflux RND transporter periplasmic adaptor subunit [Hungatella sp.]|nr:efflux RND transporter periplasmic adaptor subunit [Hungatella sp.]